MRSALKGIYGDIDRLEYLVGLFGEDRDGDSLFGNLLNSMVAYDALTQIYTNPLLSRNIFNEDTFTAYGLKLISETKSVQDLARRNVPNDFDMAASLGVWE